MKKLNLIKKVSNAQQDTNVEMREMNNAIDDLLDTLNRERARIEAVQTAAEIALEALDGMRHTIAKLEVEVRRVITSKKENGHG